MKRMFDWLRAAAICGAFVYLGLGMMRKYGDYYYGTVFVCVGLWLVYVSFLRRDTTK